MPAKQIAVADSVPELRILATIFKRRQNRAGIEPTFPPIRYGGFGPFRAVVF
jgi:hypothetical protein